jgi:hypothetical protein
MTAAATRLAHADKKDAEVLIERARSLVPALRQRSAQATAGQIRLGLPVDFDSL